MKPKIRLGIFAWEPHMSQWMQLVVKMLAKCDYAELIVLIHSAPGFNRTGLIQLAGIQKSRIMYAVQQRLERRIFEVKNQKEDESASAYERIAINAGMTNGKVSFEQDAVQRIRNYELDVLISLTSCDFDCEVKKAVRIGIWSYVAGEKTAFAGGPAHAWKFSSAIEDEEFLLPVIPEERKNVLEPNINKVLINYYWRSLHFLPVRLKELYDNGDMSIVEAKHKYGLHIHSHSWQWRHSYLQVSPIILRYLLRWSKLKFDQLLFSNQWVLLFGISGKQGNIFQTVSQLKPLIPPPDRFWADPCVVCNDERYYVFVEEYVHKNKKGHISVIEIDGDGKIIDTRPVLEKPYHLSFPFVFKHSGKYYMIPETAASRRIDIYESTCFPFEWKLFKNLMDDVNAVDTIIHKKDGRFWLFTTICSVSEHLNRDELYLYYSDDLDGSWIPHPNNPVVTDVRTSRSAGGMFEYGGKLYRPSQDCLKRYGHRVLFNEVIVINEQEYQEKTVTSIDPHWDKKIVATHTFSHQNKLTVIDAQMRNRKKGTSKNVPAVDA